MLQGQPATVMTQSKKKLKNVAMFVKQDADEDEEEEKENEPKPEQLTGRGRRTAVLESKLRVSSFNQTLDNSGVPEGKSLHYREKSHIYVNNLPVCPMFSGFNWNVCV